jgi:hypothetical protein
MAECPKCSPLEKSLSVSLAVRPIDGKRILPFKTPLSKKLEYRKKGHVKRVAF